MSLPHSKYAKLCENDITEKEGKECLNEKLIMIKDLQPAAISLQAVVIASNVQLQVLLSRFTVYNVALL